MQAVGSDHKIEPAFAAMSQTNPNPVRLFPQPGDLVAEDALDRALDPLEQQAGQLAARQGDIASSGQLAKNPRSEPGAASARVIHDPHFRHAIAEAVDVLDQSHSVGEVVAKAPEIDDVAAGADIGSALDQCRHKPGCAQPEGERRAGYSSA